MTSKLHNTFYLLFLFGSCSNQTDTNSKEPLTVNTTIDSITKVEIMYFPAFTNSSVLHLDRKAGAGTFQVDTTTTFNYGIPQRDLSFPLADMEAKTSINRFWNEKFIQTLRIDTTRPIPTDGMSVWIFYTKGNVQDSVYLGNSHPGMVDSVLLDQLNYLNNRTKDKAMKAYINQVKEYL